MSHSRTATYIEEYENISNTDYSIKRWWACKRDSKLNWSHFLTTCIARCRRRPRGQSIPSLWANSETRRGRAILQRRAEAESASQDAARPIIRSTRSGSSRAGTAAAASAEPPYRWPGWPSCPGCRCCPCPHPSTATGPVSFESCPSWNAENR